MPSPEFLGSIRDLDHQLGEDDIRLPPRLLLKPALGRVGKLIDLSENPTSLTAWLQGATVAACDGSRLEFGPFYPHTLLLQRAMAIVSNSSETLAEVDCCSPLLPTPAQEIEELARNKSMSAADAYPRWIQKKLASLEVKIAAQAIKKWQPRLLLLDGGLLLFDTLPGWPELVSLARDSQTLLVGVIEEIATAELAPLLGITDSRYYDREVLYGLLERGEALILDSEHSIKKDYRTAFTRFSSRPAAAACDFLPDTNDEDINNCLNLLYATTGQTGRGIPFLIDLVDRKVRITRQEGEVLLKMGLSANTYEKFFASQRSNRNI
ncbi:MAG: DNA double-strand break repair nuclease NurA [Methylocystaceae bacterium]